MTDVVNVIIIIMSEKSFFKYIIIIKKVGFESMIQFWIVINFLLFFSSLFYAATKIKQCIAPECNRGWLSVKTIPEVSLVN